MGNKLEGKVAIVTGSTSGIGEAAAVLYAAEGAKVVVTGRNQERGNAVVEGIKKAGGEAVFAQMLLDSGNEADYKNLINIAIDNYGRLDILFNNAGCEMSVSLDEMTIENWDLVLNTNLRAVFLMTKHAMPYLIKTKGVIINDSSIAGVKTMPQQFAYGPSKAGMIMFTQSIAMEYAKHGVRANVICPGVINTPMSAAAPKELIDAVASTIPLGRIGESNEVAKLALFLASDDSSFITGQSISICGGSSIS